MAIKFNKEAYDHAVRLIEGKLEVNTGNDNWQDIKPTLTEEVEFLDAHTLHEYGLWFLGINTEADPESKNKYEYPYGDLKIVHESALLASLEKAEKHNHHEIKKHIQELLDMIEEN